ncbi:MAG: GAF domain-containing protein [Ardenticatenaceae bacterium]|nr:GAF domain-containing protein [Ardenticatenaceae bacterium]
MNANIARIIKRAFGRLNRATVTVLLVIILSQVGLVLGYSWLLQTNIWQGVPLALLVGLIPLVIGGLLLYYNSHQRDKLQNTLVTYITQETGELQAAQNRARALQAMVSTLRATLSFERVVDAALDVCGLVLEESNIPARTLVGAVFLYERDALVPLVTRSFATRDLQKTVAGTDGIIGQALKQAEAAVSYNPAEDPELGSLYTFRNCHTAVCIPLRIGFQIFGALIIGTEAPIKFTPGQMGLFNSVADHTVIALQNAQLYQELRAEKERLVAADEAARKELARDLHDGPTQTVAAIAMRVNFIRSLIKRDPEQAIAELEKVEALARDTSRNIRGMLFTLRPLVLETEGLAAALENVMNRHQEMSGITMSLSGSEHGTMLDDRAQGVVFAIIEEALGNARKYSQASQVRVRFWQESGLFVAQVQDDGVGFDVQRVNMNYNTRGSLGMVNMRERAERIDGSIRIESQPGQGTKVTLVVPLDKHGRRATNGQRG